MVKPRIPDKGKQDVLLNIRMHRHELDQLKSYAKQRGFTVSHLIRTVLLNIIPKSSPIAIPNFLLSPVNPHQLNDPHYLESDEEREFRLKSGASRILEAKPIQHLKRCIHGFAVKGRAVECPTCANVGLQLRE